MKTNRFVFLSLVALLYGLVCFVMLVTGYHMESCVKLLGYVLTFYISYEILITTARMVLIAAADVDILHNNEDNSQSWDCIVEAWVDKIKIRIPRWLAEGLHRSGTAGSVLLELLPQLEVVLTLLTLSAAMLASINFLIATQSLVPDLIKLFGDLFGLYILYLIGLAVVRYFESYGVIEVNQ